MTDYKNYPGTDVQVQDPVVIQDPNQPIKIEPPAKVQITDGIITELIGIISLLASGGLLWVVRGIRGKLTLLSEKVEQEIPDHLIPEKEVCRIKDILAQIAVLINADRVTLGVFHNGVIGSEGAHYDKMSIVAGYCEPGVLPLPELHKKIKATNLMNDLTPLFRASKDNQSLIITRDNAPPSCALYLSRRDIHRLHNILLKSGNLEVGVISAHWCSSIPDETDPMLTYESRVKELLDEIKSIVQASRDKRRILS